MHKRGKFVSILDEVVKELDAAVNSKQLDKVMEYYEDTAILVMEPGRVAKGKSEIRDFFQFIFGMNIKAKQIATNVMETGDIALFTSRWVAEGRMPNGSDFSNENIATSVFRKGSDGKWRLVIDNSFGPDILNVQSE